MMDERSRATERAYDHAAHDFADRTAHRSDMAAAFFERLLANVPPGALVVDLGCGPGHDVRRLIQAGHATIGVDRSPALLHKCPDGTGKVRGDLRSLPLRDGSVGALWCSAALHHIDRLDIDATFADWDRVLEPGGVVGFATSLGGYAGWELVPAGAHRRPEITYGHGRWFVHHDRDALELSVACAGWDLRWSAVRSSHRDWLQALATSQR